MYTMRVPYKNFKNEPKNATVAFNLEPREVFKHLEPLSAMINWRASLENEDPRNLPVEEVVDFYNNFEKVLLEAYGELSADGEHFRKGGRFDFEESKLFAATMEIFITEPEKTSELLKGIIPDNLQDMVNKQAENLKKLEVPEGTDPQTKEAIEAEIERLRQLSIAQAADAPQSEA